MNQKRDQKFNLEDWLKTVDVWDQRYDYVMHDDHWVTTDWSPTCKECQKKPKPNLLNGSPNPPKTMPANNHLTETFVTPNTKFNDTFTRLTAKSDRRIYNQTLTTQNLINLNDTFDLYKSACEETPAPVQHETLTNSNQPCTSRIPRKTSKNFLE